MAFSCAKKHLCSLHCNNDSIALLISLAS